MLDSQPEEEFPYSKGLILKGHLRSVTALALTPDTRTLYSGSLDGKIGIWDLSNLAHTGGASQWLQTFNVPVCSLSAIRDHTRVLACGRCASPLVLAANGRRELEFIKGDPYVTDLTFTKGHVSDVTQGAFDTTNSERCLTSSLDGSLRLWDLNAEPYGIARQLPCISTLKVRGESGHRPPLSGFLQAEDGPVVLTFADDFRGRLFDLRGGFHRKTAEGTWSLAGEATGACWTSSAQTFAVREIGGRLQVFDLRRNSVPLQEFAGLENENPNVGAEVRYDKKHAMLLTGTDVAGPRGLGAIVALNPDSKKELARVSLGKADVSRLIIDEQRGHLVASLGSDLLIAANLPSAKSGVSALLRTDPLPPALAQSANFKPVTLSKDKPTPPKDPLPKSSDPESQTPPSDEPNKKESLNLLEGENEALKPVSEKLDNQQEISEQVQRSSNESVGEPLKSNPPKPTDQSNTPDPKEPSEQAEPPNQPPMSAREYLRQSKPSADFNKAIDNLPTKRPIYVPNALPMFRPDLNNRRVMRFDKIRSDDKLSKKPGEMLTGPGFGGQISGPRTTTQFMMRAIHQVENPNSDPLDLLKKRQNPPEEIGRMVDSAYAVTQPKRILDYTPNEPVEERLMSLFSKCKLCGMKICQCNRTKRII